MKTAMVIQMVLAVLFTAVVTAGQSNSPAAGDHPKLNCTGGSIPSTYLLGPDDEIEISGPELDEAANKVIRIDEDGDAQVPLIGRVHVAGLTVQQCEQELDRRLGTYIRHPEIAVNVRELHSQPVSILGAVNAPGVHQVQGHKTLLEMLSLAGGVRPDAGYSVRITRQQQWGCIPLPNATVDKSNEFSVAQVNLKNIMEANDPKENIAIFPHDVISVPKAEMVYVIGDVKRSGGFVLGENKSMSVLQALSLAEGLSTTADSRHAKILRLNGNTDQRTEIAVDVKGILGGKAEDVPLRGDDILFVPGSMGKKTTIRAVEAAVQIGTGIAIWRP
jgi:polysaccharide biosynthesis/export protein